MRKPSVKLLPFQKEDVERIYDFNGRTLIANDPGLGKTIEAGQYTFETRSYPALVLCPAFLKYNWQSELKVHFGLDSEVLKGMHPPKRKPLTTKPFIICNYEIATRWKSYFKRLKPEILILDEGHLLKTRSTKRTKTCKGLSQWIKQLLILTGTPIINRPAEIWTLINMCKPKKFPSFFSFGHKYCDAKLKPWGWEYKGAKDLEKLHPKLLKTVMIRRRKEDVLDQLPKKRRIIVSLDMKKRKQYEEAEKHFLRWLSKNESLVRMKRAMRAETIVQLGYLKRLAAQLKIESVQEWLDNFLEESDEKVVVFAIHKKVIKALKDRYKDQCLVIDGSTPIKKRLPITQVFQSNPKIRILIGNIQAMGIGLNLQGASTVVFAELAWTPGEHRQAEDRCHRMKQKRTVLCYYLLARHTIEERHCKLLQKKMKIFNALVDGKKAVDDFNIYDRLIKQMIRAA